MKEKIQICAELTLGFCAAVGSRARQRLHLLSGQGVRVGSLVEHGTLEVRICQHTFLLPIARISTLVDASLIDSLSTSRTSWHAKVGTT